MLGVKSDVTSHTLIVITYMYVWFGIKLSMIIIAILS